MTDFIFALLLMQVAGQCRVVYNFAVHRPDYWRGPKWMMIDDDCEDWGWWNPCPKSPAKWADWIGYGMTTDGYTQHYALKKVDAWWFKAECE